MIWLVLSISINRDLTGGILKNLAQFCKTPLLKTEQYSSNHILYSNL